VIRRRAQAELNKASARDEIVVGMMTALKDIDAVISILQSAESTTDASAQLSARFGLNERQSSSVVDMQLRSLTKSHAAKIEAEHNKLVATMDDLRGLLGSEERIREVMKAEAKEIAQKFGRDRRTELISEEEGSIAAVDVIPNNESFVLISELGFIKRMPSSLYNTTNRGAAGSSGGVREADELSHCFPCRDHDRVLMFTNKGEVYSCFAYDIPAASKQGKGRSLHQVVGIPADRRVTSVVSVSDEANEDLRLVFLTRKGLIMKVQAKKFEKLRASGKKAIKLNPGDELAWVRLAQPGEGIFACNSQGLGITIKLDTIRDTSTIGMGVKAMNVGQDSNTQLVGMDVLSSPVVHALESDDETEEGPWVILVTEQGKGKRLPVSHLKFQTRGGKGKIVIKLEQNDALAAARTLERPEDEMLIATMDGVLSRSRIDSIAIQSPYSRGVNVIRVRGGDRVKSVSTLSTEDSKKSK